MKKISKELEALERLKENSDYALMFVDNLYCLVDTKDNKFDVIDTYKDVIDNETQKKLKVLEIIKETIEFKQMSSYIEPNKDNDFCVVRMNSAIRLNIQRNIENGERELLRKWVLETCFPEELKALKVIKETGMLSVLKDFKGVYYLVVNNYAVEISKEKYDLLKEVLSDER